MVFTDKINRTMVAITMAGTNSTGNKTQVYYIVWLHNYHYVLSQVSFNVTVDTSISSLANGTHTPYSYPQFNTTDKVIIKLPWLPLFSCHGCKCIMDNVYSIFWIWFPCQFKILIVLSISGYQKGDFIQAIV